MLKNQPIEFYSPQLLRDYFEKYLSEKGTITPRKRETGGSWQILSHCAKRNNGAHFDRKLLCGIHDSKKLERHGSFNNGKFLVTGDIENSEATNLDNFPNYASLY